MAVTYTNIVAEKAWKCAGVLPKKVSKEEDPKFLYLTAQVQELVSKANSTTDSNNNLNNDSSEGWKKSWRFQTVGKSVGTEMTRNRRITSAIKTSTPRFNSVQGRTA